MSDLSEFELSFVTYNEQSRMYAISKLEIIFRSSGKVHVRINTEAVSIEDWRHWYVWTVDVLYLLVILYLAYFEGTDMYHAMRLGCKEFYLYWGLWNSVDWVCILLGFFTEALLIWIWLELKSAAFMNVLNSSDLTLKEPPMDITSLKLENVSDSVTNIQTRFTFLKYVMAVNTVSIVWKFFKAFTANPRLKVVTSTFRSAMDDLAHFGIVFSTIFMPFVIIGHILFGNDIIEFSSFAGSVNTGFTVLMGEYGWYLDISVESTAGQRISVLPLLPSGMPLFVVFVWYILYMFLVLLVLLNLLLAIIIEHYTKITSETKKKDYDAPVIWKQAYEFIKFMTETRRFVPLESLRRQLESGDNRIVDCDAVTEESIAEKFKDMKMPEEQPRWLYKYLNDKLHTRQNNQENIPIDNDELKEMLERQTDMLELIQNEAVRHAKQRQTVTAAATTVRSNSWTSARVSLKHLPTTHEDKTFKKQTLLDSLQKLTERVSEIQANQKLLEAKMTEVAEVAARPPPAPRLPPEPMQIEFDSPTKANPKQRDRDNSVSSDSKRLKKRDKDRRDRDPDKDKNRGFKEKEVARMRPGIDSSDKQKWQGGSQSSIDDEDKLSPRSRQKKKTKVRIRHPSLDRFHPDPE